MSLLPSLLLYDVLFAALQARAVPLGCSASGGSHGTQTKHVLLGTGGHLLADKIAWRCCVVMMLW
jgi:hypothetical protein